MSTSQDLMGLGMGPFLALSFGNDNQIVVATGNSQTTAAPIQTTNTEMTATGADGVILPGGRIGQVHFVYNSSGSTGLVYVPVGHTLSGSLNGSLSMTTHKSAIFWQYKLKFWAANLTA